MEQSTSQTVQQTDRQTDRQTPVERGGRIHFMDEVRGGDLVLMVIFHAFYVIGWLYDIEWGRDLFLFFKPVEPFFAGLFIFICGISCRLSHSNVRRGLQLVGAAALISVTMYLVMPQEMIWFGILHFMAVAILLFAALRPLLDKVPPLAGIAACTVLFVLTWGIPQFHGGVFGIKGILDTPVPASLVAKPWLDPLGLGDGTGSDYFPLLPWIFCFLCGSFIGVWAKEKRFPKWMYKSRAPWLSWIGKHTLIIYVVHQPVAYALCWVAVRFAGMFV